MGPTASRPPPTPPRPILRVQDGATARAPPSIYRRGSDMPLEKVVIITRHGERERLVKHSHVLVESSDPPLSLGGLHDVAKLGAAMRSRYFVPGCTQTSTCLGDNEEVMDTVRAESSGLARTLGTAQALMRSLLPDPLRATAAGLALLPTPVYSRLDGQDTLLRAYTKCPAHARRIARWHSSEEFGTKAADSLELRRKVHAALDKFLPPGELPPSVEDGATPLRDWWNAYDALDVAINANASDVAGAGDGSPADEELRALLPAAMQLAAWVEARKFGAELASNTCGSALLRDILKAISSPTGPKLRHYSSHYPTMLCALTSLGLSVDSGSADDTWLGDHLLPTGSALALEVNSSGLVRLYFWHANDVLDAVPGAHPKGWTRLMQPCGPDGQRSEWCSRVGFAGSVASRVLATDADWCRACDNTQLDVCRAAAAEHLVPMAGAVVPSVLVGLAIVLLVGLLLVRRRTRPRRQGRPVVTEIGGCSVPAFLSQRQSKPHAVDANRV